MAARLVIVFLFFLASQGFALPGNDGTTQDGELVKQHLAGGILDSTVQSANVFLKMMSGTSTHQISKRGISSCLPNLMLVYDGVTDTRNLYAEYQNVRKGFDVKRDKCNKIWDTNKRLKCLRDLEQEEKTAYQKVTDKARDVTKNFVTEAKDFFKCLIGQA